MGFSDATQQLVTRARPGGIAAAVRRSALLHDDAVALRFDGRTWTYTELVAAADALAAAWQADGLVAGDRVALLGRNSDWYVVAWLATQAAGLVHVPVNFMLRPKEVAYYLEHARIRRAYADRSLADVLDEAAGIASTPEPVARGSIDDPEDDGDLVPVPVAAAGDRAPTDPGPQEVAQIAYTSGTESLPKGAQLSPEGLLDQYWACIVECRFERSDRVLHALPLYHCAQMHVFMTPYLMLGAENLVVADPDPGLLLDVIEAEGITSLFCPPTVWIGLLRHADFDPERMRTVRKGYYGASIMPVETVRELADVLPDLDLWNLYGQTELGPLATVLHPADQLRKAGSAGRPALTVATRVVDEDMQDVAVGEVGEIVHRSRQVTLGYLDDDERTAAAFAGGWFHSGDLATVDDDGFITVVDRKKDMINSGGENVSSREVEEALYEHPGVAEVAVVGLPHEKWIEVVTAVVVARDGEAVDGDELVAFLGDQGMARFKQPKRVHVVDELPKNPSGKILKRDLRDQLTASTRDGTG